MDEPGFLMPPGFAARCVAADYLYPQGGAPAEAAFEVRLEDLRPLVRALVAEELERQLRQRSDCP